MKVVPNDIAAEMARDRETEEFHTFYVSEADYIVETVTDDCYPPLTHDEWESKLRGAIETGLDTGSVRHYARMLLKSKQLAHRSDELWLLDAHWYASIGLIVMKAIEGAGITAEDLKQ